VSVTAEDVKDFLRDYPEENFLTDEEDFSPALIEKAISFVVNDFNTITVITSFTAASFPFRNVLLLGVCAWLLKSEAIKQVRNHLSYSVAGIQVDDKNKGAEYSALAQQFQGEYEAKARSVKNQLNLDEGWGQISSEYLVTRSR
jgi:hypothetical protein